MITIDIIHASSIIALWGLDVGDMRDTYMSSFRTNPGILRFTAFGNLVCL